MATHVQVTGHQTEELDAEYDSDSEGETSALAFRRQVASDVEDDDDEVTSKRENAHFNEDYGAAPDEDEEDGKLDGEEEFVESDCAVGTHYASEEDERGEDISNHQRAINEHEVRGSSGQTENDDGVRSKQNPEEDKQTAEPFVVPTSGAFYMHDDRFRNKGAVRARHFFGAKKLWEAKDEQRWVHDRFEELKLNEESFSQQVFFSGGRGRQGRGRAIRGQDRRNIYGPKFASEKDNKQNQAAPARHVRGRGRGLRRARMDDYEFREAKPARIRNDNEVLSASKPMMRQPAGRSQEVESKKSQSNSMLSYESPPFFPTGAASQTESLGEIKAGKGPDGRVNSKGGSQPGTFVSTSRSYMDRGMMKVNALPNTRSPSSTGSIPSLATDLDTSSLRGSNSMKQQSSKMGSGSMLQQPRSTRPERSMRHILQQSPPSASQLDQQQDARETPSQSMQMQQSRQQAQILAQVPVSRGQPLQTQALVSPINISAQPSADSKGATTNTGNNLVNAANPRGTQAGISAGRGSFLYGGSAISNGLRSVVQFPGQQQANLGIPTMGVTLPGYSNQPQFSFPNSEVTWIPILAGGGSLSSNYSNSYIAVDGSSPAVYYTSQSSHGQQASPASTFPVLVRESNSSNTAVTASVDPPARSETDEYGQQRRRYSQMTFGEERR
ncbi:hypothetical protein KP509_26G046100 [Ceratopteris richardii]|uniref:Btz domain-containing protein n=1 Tax=Ceratopteris richardii TaxID=49495 RepID=A0A8T2RKC5_CERRI|nr:hypothetical protein KP509_26G046100 [Ceratopteris richardii]KAH7296952.1 hypothetical protein KP509_26G046100 [Ceratopteris richardii]